MSLWALPDLNRETSLTTTEKDLITKNMASTRRLAVSMMVQGLSIALPDETLDVYVRPRMLQHNNGSCILDGLDRTDCS